jgi:hypothetical protein
VPADRCRGHDIAHIRGSVAGPSYGGGMDKDAVVLELQTGDLCPGCLGELVIVVSRGETGCECVCDCSSFLVA